MRVRSFERIGFGAIALSALTVACGGSSSQSGSAVARVGRGLSMHAQSVPQGAEVCAMQEALAPPTPGATEKPTSETCAKAVNSDLLWRKAIVVLSAYSNKLEAVARGEKAETAGQLDG